MSDVHTKCVLIPADKEANNVVIVWRLYYFDTLKCELIGTNAVKLSWARKMLTMGMVAIQPYNLVSKLKKSSKKVSEYDQEIPQTHNADQPTAPWGRATGH